MGLARGQPVLVATTAPELFLRLCAALDKAGYETVGPVNTVPLAVSGLERSLAVAAIVSDDLGQLGAEIVKELKKRACPCIVLERPDELQGEGDVISALANLP